MRDADSPRLLTNTLLNNFNTPEVNPSAEATTKLNLTSTTPSKNSYGLSKPMVPMTLTTHQLPAPNYNLTDTTDSPKEPEITSTGSNHTNITLAHHVKVSMFTLSHSNPKNISHLEQPTCPVLITQHFPSQQEMLTPPSRSSP